MGNQIDEKEQPDNPTTKLVKKLRYQYIKSTGKKLE